MDYNKVQLIGRVGRDPEQKQVGGKNLSSFSVATSYGTGESQRTEWHQVTVWEKLSEIAQQLLHKGDRVFIEGRISYNTTGEGDTKKTYTQITATNLINLSAKPAGAAAGQAGTGSSTTTTGTGPALKDEDIPF